MRIGLSLLGYRGFHSSEPYNKFLEEDPSLEAILTHSGTETELKIGNQVLMKTLDKSRIEQLIELVTTEAPFEADYNRAYKMPFMAAEFFKQESSLIFEQIIEDPDLIEKLFAFFLKEEASNSTIIGYFSTVFEGLYNRFPEKLLEFVFENEFHQFFIENLRSENMVEILISCLSATYAFDDFLIERLDIMEQLLGCLGSSSPMVSTISKKVLIYVLKERLMIKKYETVFEYMLMKENLEKLFECLVMEPFVVRNFFEVLETFLENLDEEEGFLKLFEEIKVNFDMMVGILSEDLEKFDEAKLSIINFIHKLLTLGLIDCENLIYESGVLIVITEIFRSHEWNSMLGKVYCSIVSISLQCRDKLKLHLLEECCLPDTLALYSLNPDVVINNREFRRGCMGYVYKIANIIINLSESDCIIQDAIANNVLWDDFAESVIRQNKIESKELGGNDLESVETTSEEGEMKEENEVEFTQINFWRIHVDIENLEELE